MYTLMKSTIVKHKGWLVTLCLGVVLCTLMNYHKVRQISTNYLHDLINRREIANVTIVKNRLSIREQYTAEITLTSVALKRYSQLGVTFSTSEMGPHLVVFAGSSMDEVNQWERNLKDGNRNTFFVEKSY